MKITEKQKQQLNNMCVVAEEVKLGDIIAELEGGISTEIQSDWNEASVDSPAYIKNKPNISKETVEKQNEDIAKLNTNAILTQRTVQVLTEDLSTTKSEIAVEKIGQIESLFTQDKTTLVAVIKDLQERLTTLENK